MSSIHPSVVIAGDVVIGESVVIGPNAVITGPATIGAGAWIGAGAVIGAAPEVRSFELPSDGLVVRGGGGVEIGEHAVLREGVQVHQGWKGTTRVGARAYLMNQVYVAHDCELGDEVTLASSVLLAGHVVVGEGANLGLGTTVHQFRRIGARTMVGMSSVVTRDLPPFSKAYGAPARVVGANEVGLRRNGVDDEIIRRLAEVFTLDGAEADLRGLADDGAVGGVVASWLEGRTDA